MTELLNATLANILPGPEDLSTLLDELPLGVAVMDPLGRLLLVKDTCL